MDRRPHAPVATRRPGSRARLPLALFWIVVVALLGARVALFEQIATIPAAGTASVEANRPG